MMLTADTMAYSWSVRLRFCSACANSIVASIVSCAHNTHMESRNTQNRCLCNVLCFDHRHRPSSSPFVGSWLQNEAEKQLVQRHLMTQTCNLPRFQQTRAHLGVEDQHLVVVEGGSKAAFCDRVQFVRHVESWEQRCDPTFSL